MNAPKGGGLESLGPEGPDRSVSKRVSPQNWQIYFFGLIAPLLLMELSCGARAEAGNG